MIKKFLNIILIFWPACCFTQDLWSDANNTELEVGIRKEIIDDLFLISKNQSNDSFKIKNLFKVANRYWNINDIESYKKVLNYLLYNCLTFCNRDEIGKIYFSFGDYYSHWTVQKGDSAICNYDLAIKLFDNWDKKTANDVRYKKAIVYLKNSKLTESKLIINKLVSYYVATEDFNKLSELYSVLGHLLYMQGNFRAAILYYNMALRFERNPVHRANYHNNLSRLYLDRGDLLEAENHLNLAFDVSDIKNHDFLLESVLKENLAYYKHLKGDSFLEVERLYKNVLKDYDSLKYERSHIRRMIAEFYKLNGYTEESIFFLKEALALEQDPLLKLNTLESIFDFNIFDSNYVHQYEYISTNITKELLLEKNAALIANEENIEIINYLKDKLTTREVVVSGIIILFSTVLLLYFLVTYIDYRSKKFKSEFITVSKRELLDKVAKNKLSIQEHINEYKRGLAMELHDGILNNLTTIRLELGNIEFNTLEGYKVEILVNQIKRIERELRFLSHDVKGSINKGVGNLLQEMTSYISKRCKKNKIQWFLDLHPGPWNKLSLDSKLHIFRIYQELVNNLIKHSKAGRADIILALTQDNIEINYMDDGVGITKIQNNIDMGIGLSNILQRVQCNDGYMEIGEMESGTGTIIYIKFNITYE